MKTTNMLFQIWTSIGALQYLKITAGFLQIIVEMKTSSNFFFIL